MNAIIGKLIATAKAKYQPEGKKGKYILHRDAIQMTVQHDVLEMYDLSKEALHDCIEQLEAMGTFEELRNVHGYQDEEGQKYTGLVVISKIDPRISMVVDFGSKWHNDSDYFWLNRDPIDVTLKFFADVNHERKDSGIGSIPERSLAPEELDLISKLREKTESKTYTGRRVLDLIRTADPSVVVETKIIESNDKSAAYDVICKYIEKSVPGLKCKYEKSSGGIIILKRNGAQLITLWPIESGLDVVGLQPEGSEEKFYVKVTNAKVIDDGGLVKHLKAELKGDPMNQFYEDFDLVDGFGLPLAETIKQSPVKASNILPKSQEEKDEEVEERASDFEEPSEPTLVGKQIAGSDEPELMPGAGEDQDEKDLPASALKTGEAGDPDGKGEYMQNSGKPEDPQEKLSSSMIKVGKPGEDSGKHVSEATHLRSLLREQAQLRRRLNEIKSQLKFGPIKMVKKYGRIDKPQSDDEEPIKMVKKYGRIDKPEDTSGES